MLFFRKVTWGHADINARSFTLFGYIFTFKNNVDDCNNWYNILQDPVGKTLKLKKKWQTDDNNRFLYLNSEFLKPGLVRLLLCVLIDRTSTIWKQHISDFLSICSITHIKCHINSLFEMQVKMLFIKKMLFFKKIRWGVANGDPFFYLDRYILNFKTIWTIAVTATISYNIQLEKPWNWWQNNRQMIIIDVYT